MKTTELYKEKNRYIRIATDRFYNHLNQEKSLVITVHNTALTNVLKKKLHEDGFDSDVRFYNNTPILYLIHENTIIMNNYNNFSIMTYEGKYNSKNIKEEYYFDNIEEFYNNVLQMTQNYELANSLVYLKDVYKV